MKAYIDPPIRRSTRLEGFDYSADGAYYLTICSHERECIFSSINNGVVKLSPIGRIIEREWFNTHSVRPYVTVDEIVIMPNHVHCILFIHHDSMEPDHLRNEGTSLYFPEGYRNKFGPQSGNLASVVRGFKSAVTAEARKIGVSIPIWQSRYYERVIRNQKELEKFRSYIKRNPFDWKYDPNW